MDNEKIIPEVEVPVAEETVTVLASEEVVAQPEPEIIEEKMVKICTKCGSIYENEISFCAKCGNQLQEAKESVAKRISEQATATKGDKKKSKKLLIIIIAIVVAIVGIIGIIAIADGSSSSSSSSSSYVNPYVNMVKNATNSKYGITYGKAFNNFFSNCKWSHFTATTGEQVVEFTGKFSYDGSPATAKIQFIVDVSEGTFTAYYLSINDVPQSKLMLATLINKVFESY